MILVEASVEQTAQTFSQIRYAHTWERDVYGREIEIMGWDYYVFQFLGHTWTTIYGRSYLWEPDAQLISRLLNKRTIYYWVSDTGGAISYQLYDGNGLVEMLDDRSEDRFPRRFQSRLRQIEAKDIKDVLSFTNDFFLEQDVYVPFLYLDNFRPRQCNLTNSSS